MSSEILIKLQAEMCNACTTGCDRRTWAEGGCLEEHPPKLIVVTRHKGAAQFIARYLGRADLVWHDKPEGNVVGEIVLYDICGDAVDSIRILGSATVADVKGRIVYGNLPLDLAAHAYAVGSICFTGTPPRGAEYSLADMDAAGAEIRWFKVRTI